MPTSNTGVSRPRFCCGQVPRKTLWFHPRSIGKSLLDPIRRRISAEISSAAMSAPIGHDLALSAPIGPFGCAQNLIRNGTSISLKLYLVGVGRNSSSNAPFDVRKWFHTVIWTSATRNYTIFMFANYSWQQKRIKNVTHQWSNLSVYTPAYDFDLFIYVVWSASDVCK